MSHSLSSSASVRLTKIGNTMSSHQNYGKSHRALPGTEFTGAQFQKRQLTAMRKATDVAEVPPKEKHVRFLLLGCAHEKKASTFWWAAKQLPLSSQPVVAWKFFYILHRLIKQSSQAVATTTTKTSSKLSPVLRDCFEFHSHMKQIGELWKGMLHMPYASLIAEYSQLISNRLDFHKKFQEEMPGGELDFSDTNLTSDINYLFEVSADVCDQLEAVLALAQSIMNTMNFGAATDSTPEGQCRLTACPLLIMDSSKLYDYLVKVLFRMHNLLPPDVLEGHRSRFKINHKKLKKFYDRSKVLHYVRSKIEIPSIPDNAPDFLATAEFQGTDVAEEVRIVEAPEDSIADTMSLIDIDDIFDLPAHTSTPRPVEVVQPPQNAQHNVLVPQLLEEIEHLKSKLASLERDHQEEVLTLFHALGNAKTQLEEKNLKIEELQSKVVPNSEKLTTQAQNIEKLYQVVRGKYMKLVQDHSKLLSQQQDANRETGRLNALLSSRLDTGVILTALSMRAQQIVISAENDRVILAEEKAEQLLVERSARALENGLSGIHSVADENVPELCSMMINLAAQLNSILVIGFNHCEAESRELVAATTNFYQRFATEKHINTTKWADEAGIKPILERIKNLRKSTSGEAVSVETEMAQALKVVEDSMRKMQEMLAAARDSSNALKGISPEILDICKELMGLIRLLILDATSLQESVVAAGNTGLSPAEFYHKNSRWTDGLISAAKAVGWAAQYLTHSADESLKGTGKVESLQVACKETVASTAQLVSASKVKAPQNTQGVNQLNTLVQRSMQVNECAGRVLAKVRDDIDAKNHASGQIEGEAFGNIMKARKMEIDTSVRIQELENELQAQRDRLGVVRGSMYRDRGEAAAAAAPPAPATALNNVMAAIMQEKEKSASAGGRILTGGDSRPEIAPKPESEPVATASLL